jgi:hypothetical protein
MSEVNALWEAPRWVKLDREQGEVRGQFVGVDAQGRLELARPGQPSEFFDPQQVRCLREIEPIYP